jgi:primosomal protein N' (replication factor Y)
MVSQALRKGTGQVFLLHDWDGGGRFEVYLRLVEEALHQGRSALILVPEIALTPKLLGRFSQRFPNCLAPFYSTLTRSQLKRCWHGARTGQIRAVVGSRSAVFVPLNDLGLIIVAEEEDTSYKERRRPYYNARDVAIARGGIARAVVLLSSLAPSLESIFKVKQGEYKFLKLSGSKAHKPNPLKIVDMRKKWGVLISAPLRDEIRRKLMTGEPIILFLNRRGFARSISCSECGWVAQCPNCGLPLIYHRVDRGFKCHLCNYRQPGFDECPRCHGSQFIYTGMGTQRLEEELRRLIPGVQIQRLDGDTLRSMRAKSARFHPGPSIYLGTMAVIQGFQFPARALLGMVSADTFLDRPDFRASERLFQFLIRAARRADQVVVQTAHPDSYAIRYAQDQKFEPFYAAELKLRQTLNYPPFSRLVRLIYPTTQSDVINLETLRQLPGVEVYGPEHKLGRISTSTVVLKVPPNITLEEVLMPERLHRFGVRVEVDPLEL